MTEAKPKLPIKTKHIGLTLTVRKTVKDSGASLSDTVSKAVGLAMTRPMVMVHALEARLRQPAEPVDQRATIYYPVRVRRCVSYLAHLSRLSEEEVIRLCIEAFVSSQRGA
jgi:hypothetical protein